MLTSVVKKLYMNQYKEHISKTIISKTITHPIHKYLSSLILVDNKSVIKISPNYNPDIIIESKLEMEIANLNTCLIYQLKNNSISLKKKIVRDKKWVSDNLSLVQNFWNNYQNFKRQTRSETKKRNRNSKTQTQNKSKKRRLVSILENQQDPRDPASINWDDWVSAGKTRNYIINDPLLDWLNLYANNPRLTFKNPLFDMGNQFEDDVIELIRSRFGKNNVIEIAKNVGEDSRNFEMSKKTLEEMKKGTPILYQAVLHNFKDKTYGVADLLIRSDYLNLLVAHPVLNRREERIKSPILKRFHYRVIDIKYSTLALLSDSNQLRNTYTSKPYKSQLCVYNNALGELQNYLPDKAYVLGYRWKREKNKEIFQGFDCLDLLGEVDFKNRDVDFIKQTAEAINWYRDVKTNGSSWSIDPPTRDELMPNMSNRRDEPWRKTKEYLANKHGEITLINGCGVKQRSKAIEKDVYRWDDDNCNSELMGIKGPKMSVRVNSILDINRSNFPIILPKKMEEIRENKKVLDLYVDFEYCTRLPKFNQSNMSSIVYLIGLSYLRNNKIQYEFFLVDSLDHDEEKKIFTEFSNFINKLKKKNQELRLHHWGHAEFTVFKRVQERHNTNFGIKNENWYNLLNFVKDNNIFVNGSYNFGLKEFSKAMYNNGMINTIWKEGMSGLKAMASIERCNYKAFRTGCRIRDIREHKKIIEYNWVDCQVLYEILKYFRTNI